MNERYERIKARAKLLRGRIREMQLSGSYARVVGVLSGLGFLIAPGVPPRPSSKVELEEALHIGASVEPRVLEVVPAAVLSFPKSFLHPEKSPPQFQEVVDALRTGKAGPDFGGISFEKFLEAANRPIKSRKRKIASERRISRTFRFSQPVLRTIRERSKRMGITGTAYLEQLVESDRGK